MKVLSVYINDLLVGTATQFVSDPPWISAGFAAQERFEQFGPLFEQLNSAYTANDFADVNRLLRKVAELKVDLIDSNGTRDFSTHTNDSSAKKINAIRFTRDSIAWR